MCVCVCVSLYVLIAYPQQATSRVSRDREFGDFAILRTVRCALHPYVCIRGEGVFAILMSVICAFHLYVRIKWESVSIVRRKREQCAECAKIYMLGIFIWVRLKETRLWSYGGNKY